MIKKSYCLVRFAVENQLRSIGVVAVLCIWLNVIILIVLFLIMVIQKAEN